MAAWLPTNNDSAVRLFDRIRTKTQNAASRCVQKAAMDIIQDMCQRVRSEYLEMPGLRLKAEQVQRLCGIERPTCETVLDTLVDAKFLYVKSDGHYLRVTDGRVPRPHPAKANLRTDAHSRCAS
jgi:hypothetical protein